MLNEEKENLSKVELWKKKRPNNNIFTKENQPKNRGQKKGAKSIVPIIKSLLKKPTTMEIEGILINEKAEAGDLVTVKKDNTTAEQLALILIEKARNDADTKAITYLIDQLDGKAKQSIEIDNEAPVLTVEATSSTNQLGDCLNYIAIATESELVKIDLALTARKDYIYYSKKQATDKEE